METLDPQGFLKRKGEAKEKIKWDATKTSEKKRKEAKTEDRDLWIELYTSSH